MNPWIDTTDLIAMSDLNATFKEIQSDPDVCSNCFRRTHDRYERNYRLETTQVEDEDGKMQWTKIPVSVEGLEITLPDGSTEVIGGMDDDVFRIDDSTMEIPEDGAHRGITHVCVCGFRWGPEEVIDEWKNRPLDKRTFFEYADHLLDRLRESDVGLDEDVFMEELDRLKSNPDQQFADDRIYSNAIEYASSLETVRDTA